MARVLADGVFDPIHYGHVCYLRAASTLGPPLVVRVAPDAAIVAKGRTPFQSLEERARTVLAIGCVDRVVMDDSLAHAIAVLRPDYLVKGGDWRGKLPADVLAACESVGAEIIYTDTQERTSTERLADCDPGDCG